MYACIYIYTKLHRSQDEPQPTGLLTAPARPVGTTQYTPAPTADLRSKSIQY